MLRFKRSLSIVMLAVLLVSCAAPAAAPTVTVVPPTPTSIPPTSTPLSPTPTPDPLAIVKAYTDAWNRFDAEAWFALFADSFDASYDGNRITNTEELLHEYPFGFATGLQMTIEPTDCEVSDDTVTCRVLYHNDCRDGEVSEVYTLKDGKIQELVHLASTEENAETDKTLAMVKTWAIKKGVEEWRTFEKLTGSGVWNYEAGAALAAVCRKYAAAQTQAPDPAAPVKAWVNAINNGDLEAALALMTQDATFQGAFTEPAPNVVDWWIDIGSKHVVPVCQLQSDQVTCTYIHSDGCIAAFGATGGLPVKMTFTLQDGKIRQVLVETQGDEWASYGQWSDAELDWAQANRAEELAKIDFQTLKEGGATAVELCREYAAANPTPTPTPMALAEPGKVATTFGKITSQALAGNLLGDPTTRTYYVLLPPGYTVSEKRYPVVYVLHWFTGDATSLVEDFHDSYQAALNEGDAQEMIFVFPDASNKLGGSQYLSSPTIGDYETYLTQELVKEIDATYRTRPERTSRGITGCSMGGAGSIYLTLKYPSVFTVAAPVSGGYGSSGYDDWLLEQATDFLKNPPKDFEDAQALPWQTLSILSWAAATASDPEKPPFYLDMPFEMRNGKAQLVPEVFGKMTANDPVDELDRYLAQPERLSAILIYHGNRDEITPVEEARDFDKLLTDRGVEHEYLEVNARHCDFGYLGYVPVIKFMSDHLSGEEQPKS